MQAAQNRLSSQKLLLLCYAIVMPIKRVRALVQVLDDIDPVVVKRRVQNLRSQFPQMDRAELHKTLVRGKCLQAGAAGAIHAIIDLVPGGKILAPKVIGNLSDPQLLTILQAELVLETLEVYEVDATPAMRQALLAGLGVAEAPKIVIEKWLENDLIEKLMWLGRLRWLSRAYLVKRLVAAAADPMTETYAIGQRAAAVAQMPKARLFEWPSLIAKAARLDDSKLASWAIEATKSAAQQAQSAFSNWFENLSTFGAGVIEAKPPKAKKTRSANGPNRRSVANSTVAKKAAKTKQADAKSRPTKSARSTPANSLPKRQR